MSGEWNPRRKLVEFQEDAWPARLVVHRRKCYTELEILTERKEPASMLLNDYQLGALIEVLENLHDTNRD